MARQHSAACGLAGQQATSYVAVETIDAGEDQSERACGLAASVLQAEALF